MTKQQPEQPDNQSAVEQVQEDIDPLAGFQLPSRNSFSSTKLAMETGLPSGPELSPGI